MLILCSKTGTAAPCYVGYTKQKGRRNRPSALATGAAPSLLDAVLPRFSLALSMTSPFDIDTPTVANRTRETIRTQHDCPAAGNQTALRLIHLWTFPTGFACGFRRNRPAAGILSSGTLTSSNGRSARHEIDVLEKARGLRWPSSHRSRPETQSLSVGIEWIRRLLRGGQGSWHHASDDGRPGGQMPCRAVSTPSISRRACSAGPSMDAARRRMAKGRQ